MISNKASSPGSAQSVVSYDVRRKLDSLFFTWMSDKTTQNRIRELIGNNNDTTLTADSNSDISFTQPSPPLSPKSTKNKKSFKKTTSPLRSPRSPPPRSPKGNKNTTSSSASTKTVSPSSSPLKKESSATSNELPRTSLDEFKLDNHPPQAPSSPPATTTSETKTDASILNKTDEAIKNEATAPTAPATSLIKTFWVPNEGGRGRGKRLIRDTLSNRAAEITTLFAEYPKGMSHENFVAVTKDLCNLPSFFSTPLHIRVRYLWLEKIETEMKNGTETKSSESKTKKMDAKMFKKMKKELMMEEGLVSHEMFLYFWTIEIEPFDRFDRFFRLIKRPDRQFIFPSDFDPFLKELLKYHPGLEFLETAPEFQDKYMRTVTARIFFTVDRFQRWRLSVRDIRRSEPNLLAAFDAVDENDDINQVHNYFSYEHFYVLYCKFWELDTDRDFLLNRDDLLRYGGHALTRRTIDRVFQQSGRQFLCSTKNKMGYEDFCFFMLAEEDKSTRASIQYWFNVIDLDSDGVIRPYEMKLFYDEQLHRMECLGHELVPFDDIYCQMCDLVGLKPLALDNDRETFDEFVVDDFLKGGPDHMQLTGNFFNMLFNLNKFVAFEQRDPFLLKQQRTEAGQVMTLWARFAAIEYARLAMEEEMREQEQVQVTNGWSN